MYKKIAVDIIIGYWMTTKKIAELVCVLLQIAAFIAEPVMGAGGVIPPPATYFDKVVIIFLVFFQ